MRIFFVDDARDFRETLELFFDMFEHDVVSAGDPTQCPVSCLDNETCRYEHPCCDAMILDQNMPNMTGLEFVQMQLAKGCHLEANRRAIVSANLTRDEAELAGDLGCAIFRKPFPLRSLQDWLENIEKSLPDDRVLAGPG